MTRLRNELVLEKWSVWGGVGGAGEIEEKPCFCEELYWRIVEKGLIGWAMGKGKALIR